MEELLRAVDTCPSIDKLFELVKNEHIVIRMKSQQGASNIPFRPLPEKPGLSPLESLRKQVRDAVLAMYKPAAKPQPDSKERLLYKVDTCQSIDKLFELVKNEHIVIHMKSQNSASCLPQHRLSGSELTPDTTPLERLKQQVLQAVIYG